MNIWQNNAIYFMLQVIILMYNDSCSNPQAFNISNHQALLVIYLECINKVSRVHIAFPNAQ